MDAMGNNDVCPVKDYPDDTLCRVKEGAEHKKTAAKKHRRGFFERLKDLFGLEKYENPAQNSKKSSK